MTTLPHIDAARAIELLELAVAERGADYVYEYEFCEYVHNGEPACIVGLALDKAGIDLNALRRLGPINDLYNKAYASEMPFTISDDAIRAWRAAQYVQDGWAWQAAQYVQDGTDGRYERGTWGDALAAAKAALS